MLDRTVKVILSRELVRQGDILVGHMHRRKIYIYIYIYVELGRTIQLFAILNYSYDLQRFSKLGRSDVLDLHPRACYKDKDIETVTAPRQTHMFPNIRDLMQIPAGIDSEQPVT